MEKTEFELNVLERLVCQITDEFAQRANLSEDHFGGIARDVLRAFTKSAATEPLFSRDQLHRILNKVVDKCVEKGNRLLPATQLGPETAIDSHIT